MAMPPEPTLEQRLETLIELQAAVLLGRLGVPLERQIAVLERQIERQMDL
jgi:hypothetical protein